MQPTMVAFSMEIDISNKWAIFYQENARRDTTLPLTSHSATYMHLIFLTTLSKLLFNPLLHVNVWKYIKVQYFSISLILIVNMKQLTWKATQADWTLKTNQKKGVGE